MKYAAVLLSVFALLGCQGPTRAITQDADAPLQVVGPQVPLPPECPIAVVDMDGLMRSDAKLAKEQLAIYEESQDAQLELRLKYEELKKALEVKLKAWSVRSKEYAQLMDQIIELDAKYKLELGNLALDAQADYRQMIKVFRARLNKAAAKIAKQLGFQLVLDSSMRPITTSLQQWEPERSLVVYLDQAVDITENVKAEMQAVK
jgi:Skp family chaperone for outer membrane proteins